VEEEPTQRYQTFEDLKVYQAAREFRKTMYRVAKRLPAEEKYGLAPQIRTAAVSLTNNIAEGHGRFHFLDQTKFMFNSRGSLEELIDDLNVCEDEQYLPLDEINCLKAAGWDVHRQLGGYIRYLRSRLPKDPSRVNEAPGNELLEDFATDPFNSSTIQPFN